MLHLAARLELLGDPHREAARAADCAVDDADGDFLFFDEAAGDEEVFRHLRGAVIAELGRQPIMAKQFFTKYQDRILFGKDSWVPEEYATYFRVLETEDEYFPYHKKYHAFWRMYGIGLPDAILKKVYYKNALRILPRIDKSRFPD